MKKYVDIESKDNKFRDWSSEQLWDHFTAQVVDGWSQGSPIENYHTWLRWIHRADVIPGHYTITDRLGHIQVWGRNHKNDPRLEQQIMERLQRQEDILAGRE